MSEDTITIEINGREVQTYPGRTIIEAADNVGISIPRFCYHKKLSVAANCRMCMVEVEKAPKPLPACATPVADGMKIFTESPVARDAQKGTMEFLLINHPLDCPICDQGGECELQDVAVTYGSDVSRFSETKREVPDPDLGPLIATDMNRCIHCTRCVRFGEEIAGVRELGATGRGEFVKIGTFIQKSVDSELSGNVIDVCPVGALTAKPSRFKYRPWELVEMSGIAAHDCIGSNVSLHINKGKVTRVIPAENEAVNECWIADRDRFSYEGLYSRDRVTSPQMKVKGKWEKIGWDVALNEVIKRSRPLASDLGVLVSPSSTTEEMYLLQKLLREMGGHSIDHRLRQTDFRNQNNAPLVASLGTSLEALEKHDAVFLIGSNIRKEQPVAGLKLRKAALKGASIMALNTRDYEFYFDLDEQLLVAPADMVSVLTAIAEASAKESGTALSDVFGDLKKQSSEQTDAVAKRLHEAGNALILLGPQALNHPDQSLLSALASEIASADNITLGYLPEGANTTGAALAGALPHRGVAGAIVEQEGANAHDMLAEGQKAYWLFGVEPESDCADSAQTLTALTSAETVVAFATHSNVSMYEYADIILPIAAAPEKAGSLTNIDGNTQFFMAATRPPGEAKSGWAVLRMLGVTAGLDSLAFDDLAAVRAELEAQLSEMPEGDNRSVLGESLSPVLQPVTGSLQRYSECSIYGVDPVVRRSRSLQTTQDALEKVFISSTDAEKLQFVSGDHARLTQGAVTEEFPVEVDTSLASGNVCIKSGGCKASRLGAAYATIQLAKV